MLRFQRIRLVLSVLLVLGLAGAPLAPVFAGAAKAASPVAVHVHHAPAGDVAAADVEALDRAGCAQHEQCQGHCCSACAHCVVALPGWSASHVPVRAMHEPVVSRLFSEPPVTVLPRPPQPLS